MALSNQNFKMYQAEDKKLIFTILDDDNSAKDLTGASVEWAMTKENHSVTKTSAETTEISLSENVATVIILSADTASIPNGKTYLHELRVTDADGISSVCARGKVRLYDSLTR